MNVARWVRGTAGVCAAALLYFYCPNEPLRGFGIAQADAKAFYTRKRVHGRWITGRFPKRHAVKAPRNDNRGAASRVTATALPSSRAETAPEKEKASPERAPLNGLALRATLDPPVPTDDGLLKLRDALQTRASQLANVEGQQPTTTGSIGSAQRPRSIIFDFEKSTKTTSYADGMNVEESFDTALEQRVAPWQR